MNSCCSGQSLRIQAALSIIGMSLCALGARAEVVSAASDGFNLRHAVEIPGVVQPAVWAALSDVARWWDSEHTYSGDARNLSLEPVVRGCFCEKLSLYAGVEHATVVFAQPTQLLRLRGAIGPLQELGVSGSLTFSLEAEGGGTRVTMTYNVGGFAAQPLADWAPIVDEVLSEQLERLARFAATGSPELPPEQK